MLFGDVDNDGIGDIITMPKTQGGANVRVYKYVGHIPTVQLLDWVQAYGSDFRGETSLVMDDVTGDGQLIWLSLRDRSVARMSGFTPGIARRRN